MHPAARLGSKTAALLAALLLVGTADAQGARPAAPAPVPQVHKLTIYNGMVPTVSYSADGGSPRLQALCETLQFTENELNLTKELQTLRLGIVVNEQTLDSVRTSQQMGLGPISTPGYPGYDGCYGGSYSGCYGPPTDSALKCALIPQLAQESTPALAFEFINLREQLQNELLAEQGKGVAAVRGQPAAKPNAQPAAPMAGPMAVPPVAPMARPMPFPAVGPMPVLPAPPVAGPMPVPPAAPVTVPAQPVQEQLPMPLWCIPVFVIGIRVLTGITVGLGMGSA